MLTADLAQSWWRGNSVRPLYISPDDADYLQDAAHLIKIISDHEGRARGELDEVLERYVGTGTNYKILRGLIKLLMDRCRFEVASAKEPVEIRRTLFLKATKHHPVTQDENVRQEVIREAARELGCAPETLTAGLYADLPENQKLAGFKHLNATELLNLYNLAQAQALLYHCVEMRLSVETQEPDAYRELFGAIKAYRLIHTIKGSPEAGYEVRLDGPVSLFHRSQKYGVQMAVFLPALLLCKGWRMRAEIAQAAPNNPASAFFELGSNQRRLNSHYLSDPLSENSVLEKFAVDWGRVETSWELEPSREVLDLGGSAFIPDFALRRADGQRFYLEVLGFWTPQHLKERLAEFEHAGFKNFILAAWDELRGSRDPLTRIPPHTIIFKRSLDPVAVEMAVNELISQGSQPQSEVASQGSQLTGHA
jgi:predicted nuclease of restriction endonuclease-like RecB superfamily